MSTEPFVSVPIGAREIYDAVMRVSMQMERIEQQMAERVRELDDHESRLRSLEKGRWPLPALAVLLSAASLAAVVVKLIR